MELCTTTTLDAARRRTPDRRPSRAIDAAALTRAPVPPFMPAAMRVAIDVVRRRRAEPQSGRA